MKTRSTFRFAMPLIALAVGTAFSIAAWQTQRVAAVQGPDFRRAEFRFVDLGVNQTARLNVVNLVRQPPPDGDSPAPDPDSPPPEPDVPGNRNHARRVRLAFDIYVQPPPEPDAPSCVTRYRFLRRESREVELMPGQAASFEFLASAVTKINASVHFLGGPDTLPGDNQRTPEPHLAPTLEVRESARTIFVVPAVAKFFNPQPDPPGQQQ